MEVLHDTATECHLPYGITQCYLLPDSRHKWTHPTLTPAMQAGTRFTYPREMEGWVDLVNLIAPRPGVKPATLRSRIQCSTNATTNLKEVTPVKAIVQLAVGPKSIHSGNRRPLIALCCLLVVLVVALVERWTRDRKVTGSTPGRGAIKSTRSTQPSIPPG